MVRLHLFPLNSKEMKVRFTITLQSSDPEGIKGIEDFINAIKNRSFQSEMEKESKVSMNKILSCKATYEVLVPKRANDKVAE